jgi:hypothetical protein
MDVSGIDRVIPGVAEALRMSQCFGVGVVEPFSAVQAALVPAGIASPGGRPQRKHE